MLVRRSLCVSWITTTRLLSSYLVMLPFFHWHSFCWSLQIAKKNGVSPWVSQYPWRLYSTQITKTAKHQVNQTLNGTESQRTPFSKVARDITYLGFFRVPFSNGPVGDFLDPGPWCFGDLQGWENVADHVRQVFGRMGFRDREAVCLKQREEDGDGERSSKWLLGVGWRSPPTYSPQKKHMKRYIKTLRYHGGIFSGDMYN